MNKYKLMFCALFMGISTNIFADNLFKTGVQIIEFQDASRNNKIVPIQLFYPVNVHIKTEPITKGIAIRKEIVRNAPISEQFKNYPLIIYSHGHGGSMADMAWLADILVPKGYIIASLEHSGNGELIQKPELLASHLWDRPLDVSFVLTKLLDHPEWKMKIDPTKIVDGGFSRGGATAVFLAGGQMNGSNLKTYVETYFLDKNEAAPYVIKLIESMD